MLKNIFEISPFKFNVKCDDDKYRIMWLKYDPDSDIFPEIFEKSELRKGLFVPKITNDLDTPNKRVKWFISVSDTDLCKSHCYYAN